MSLVTLPVLAGVLVVGTATLAFAAGGGGSAGGSGAQNAPRSGHTMADGQPGPAGSPNNAGHAPRAHGPTGRAGGR